MLRNNFDLDLETNKRAFCKLSSIFGWQLLNSKKKKIFLNFKRFLFFLTI